MITVEQARKLYPADQCPPDRDLERMLATAYAIAEREWEEIVSEKNLIHNHKRDEQ